MPGCVMFILTKQEFQFAKMSYINTDRRLREVASVCYTRGVQVARENKQKKRLQLSIIGRNEKNMFGDYLDHSSEASFYSPLKILLTICFFSSAHVIWFFFRKHRIATLSYIEKGRSKG